LVFVEVIDVAGVVIGIDPPLRSRFATKTGQRPA
jgi:hypothetical protein